MCPTHSHIEKAVLSGYGPGSNSSEATWDLGTPLEGSEKIYAIDQGAVVKHHESVHQILSFCCGRMFWMFLVTNKMSSAVGPAAIHAN